ncbi:MAG: NADH-quinone oxidoreductase subunit NuoK [Chloroflexi bacterium]|jgi:NADH-quinone oxidoreductase subunit K|nr:NADH-quinone oxidoreductase subunit NuoK [Chloroflexota bacterium]
MIPTYYYVALGAIMFAIGVIGVLVRRNVLVTFMSVEMMLNAANLVLVAFAFARQDILGQVIVFFVIVVAAAEVAVGLALLMAIFRTRQTTNVDDMTLLKG